MGEGGEQLNLKKKKDTFTVGTGAHTAVPTAGRHRGAHCGAHRREAQGRTLRCPQPGGTGAHTAVPTAGRHRALGGKGRRITASS